MRQTSAFLISVFFSVLSGTAEAYCYQEAARAYGVDARLLVAISGQESGSRMSVVHPVNPNGTRDYCMMGINESWFPILNRYGVSPASVLQDPCTCVMVGAWVLARCFRQVGVNWRGIGCYNAKSEDKRNAYAWKIWQRVYGVAPRNGRRSG